MNTKETADLLGTSPDTIRRWASKEYTQFLSPGATPPKGDDREFNEHDLRVFWYVTGRRSSHASHDTIRDNLTTMQVEGWEKLPPVPKEWNLPLEHDGRITVGAAAEQAKHIARIATLEMQVTTLRDQLDTWITRAEKAERELDNLRATQNASDAQLHTAELELERARGQVATLEARLSGYAITGGNKPIPVAAIIIVALAVGAILVLITVIVTRLVL